MARCHVKPDSEGRGLILPQFCISYFGDSPKGDFIPSEEWMWNVMGGGERWGGGRRGEGGNCGRNVK